MKPKGIHRGCALTNEIERTEQMYPRIVYESTYGSDYTDKNKNFQITLFSTAPHNNPSTWTTYLEQLERSKRQVLDFFFEKKKTFAHVKKTLQKVFCQKCGATFQVIAIIVPHAKSKLCHETCCKYSQEKLHLIIKCKYLQKRLYFCKSLFLFIHSLF